jgi:hypothetical protein
MEVEVGVGHLLRDPKLQLELKLPESEFLTALPEAVMCWQRGLILRKLLALRVA